MEVPNFYAVLATLCYTIVTYKLWRLKMKKSSITFGILTTYYFFLHSYKPIFSLPEFNDMMWGAFNVGNAVLFMYVINKIYHQNKKYACARENCKLREVLKHD